MSYSNIFIPEQSYVYSHVGGTNLIGPNGQNIDANLSYIKDQNRLLFDQEQKLMGKIPRYIDPTLPISIVNSLSMDLYIPQIYTRRFENNYASAPSAQTLTQTSTQTSTQASTQTSTQASTQTSTQAPILQKYEKTDPNTQEFNPYFDYQQKRGLSNQDYNFSVTKRFVNFDSSNRRINPTVTTTSPESLPMDPFFFQQTAVTMGAEITQQNLMWIYTAAETETEFKPNDKVSITGFCVDPVTYSSLNPDGTPIYLDQEGNPSTDQFILLQFYANHSYIRINLNPNMPIKNAAPFGTNDWLATYAPLQAYDTSDMFVTITGFLDSLQPSTTPTPPGPYIPTIAGVPVNLLDTTHQIYIFLSPSDNPEPPDVPSPLPFPRQLLYSLDHFYIKLPPSITFDADSSAVLYGGPGIGTPTLTPLTLTFKWRHYGGIPNNKILAQYPIDNLSLQGYHIVFSTAIFEGQSYFSIPLQKTGYSYSYNLQPFPPPATIETFPLPFGSCSITTMHTTQVISGYPNPNYYVIDLPFAISDIVKIRLVNTIFPNLCYTFTNNPNNPNNKMYWQNEEDGPHTYTIEITPGNYTASELSTEIEQKVRSTPRIYNTNDGSFTSSYVNSINAITVTIDETTDTTTFKSFKEVILYNPIIDISLFSIPSNQWSITFSQVLQPDQDNNTSSTFPVFNTNDIISFTGLLDTYTIPAHVLNNTFTITTATPTSFTVITPSINSLTPPATLPPTPLTPLGGYTGKAYIPINMRLLWNFSDTFGQPLGFRNVGSPFSITPLSPILTNNDAYDHEFVTTDQNGIKYVYDPSGNPVVLEGDCIDLYGNEYIVMVVEEFSEMYNVALTLNDKINDSNKISKIFAKLNMIKKAGHPDRFVFDKFAHTPFVFSSQFSLDKMTVSFYDKNGILVNFNGIDHSYVIEFTSLDYIPIGTSINTRNSMF